MKENEILLSVYISIHSYQYFLTFFCYQNALINYTNEFKLLTSVRRLYDVITTWRIASQSNDALTVAGNLECGPDGPPSIKQLMRTAIENLTSKSFKKPHSDKLVCDRRMKLMKSHTRCSIMISWLILLS